MHAEKEQNLWRLNSSKQASKWHVARHAQSKHVLGWFRKFPIANLQDEEIINFRFHLSEVFFEKIYEIWNFWFFFLVKNAFIVLKKIVYLK